MIEKHWLVDNANTWSYKYYKNSAQGVFHFLMGQGDLVVFHRVQCCSII